MGCNITVARQQLQGENADGWDALSQSLRKALMAALVSFVYK